jgi:uncharacterized protein
MSPITPASDNLPCLCCGTCCTRFRILLTFADAERLAAHLTIPLEFFLEHFIEEPWNLLPGLLLRQDEGRCPFLAKRGNHQLCGIHEVKPEACRDWPAGLKNRVCRDGLLCIWGLTVNAAGQPAGTPEQLAAFQAFRDSPVAPPTDGQTA